MHPVVLHRVGRFRCRERLLEGLHVGCLDDEPDVNRSVSVDARSCRYAKGSEDFLALWRGKPVFDVVNIMRDKQRSHVARVLPGRTNAQ